MIERFLADPERRLLIQALLQQPLIGGDAAIARLVADCAQLEAVAKGAAIITQGATDNDLLLIVSGRFAILVNGTPVAERLPGQHVGEMSVISPEARRSATVTALEDSVVARVSEADFSRLAQTHVTLWRALAAELASRIRQRNRLVRQANEQPHIFIGSSVEGLDVGRAIQNEFAHDRFVVRPWASSVFEASVNTIDALQAEAAFVDFAVLVLKPDDILELRGTRIAAPRDNVIFELGLFMGTLGKHRTFMVHPQGVDLRIPTDLLGVTPLTYGIYHSPAELAARVGPVCNQIRALVNAAGPR